MLSPALISNAVLYNENIQQIYNNMNDKKNI